MQLLAMDVPPVHHWSVAPLQAAQRRCEEFLSDKFHFILDDPLLQASFETATKDAQSADMPTTMS